MTDETKHKPSTRTWQRRGTAVGVYALIVVASALIVIYSVTFGPGMRPDAWLHL